MSLSQLRWHKSAICCPAHLVLSYAVASKFGNGESSLWANFIVFTAAFVVQVAVLLAIENVLTRQYDSIDAPFEEEKPGKRKRLPREAKKAD